MKPIAHKNIIRLLITKILETLDLWFALKNACHFCSPLRKNRFNSYHTKGIKDIKNCFIISSYVGLVYCKIYIKKKKHFGQT